MLFDSAEELGALVEQRCLGGVEVLRSAAIGAAAVGVPAADEPENLAVVDDRKHDPVAEPVNETAGAGSDRCRAATQSDLPSERGTCTPGGASDLSNPQPFHQ
jgi:hypothetical protein